LLAPTTWDAHAFRHADRPILAIARARSSDGAILAIARARSSDGGNDKAKKKGWITNGMYPPQR
jgi:hypothetical protein